MVNLNPLFPLAMANLMTVHEGRGRYGQDEGGESGDVEPFYVCDFIILISSVLIDWSKWSTKLLCLCKIYT